MIILIALVLGLYLFMITEEDPLTVEYVPNEPIWSKCDKRKYTFRRIVRSTKDIDVHVREVYMNLDGMDDVGDIQAEVTGDKQIDYPLKAGVKVIGFNKKVLDNLTYGRYIYMPEASYEVNAFKRVVKALPPQFIEVVCNKEDLE
jgi:hypothetical protein